MASIKAYHLAGRIVVQFYDTGAPRQLHCPFCSWEGRLSSNEQPIDTHCCEVSCKQCHTPLAMISSEVTDYIEADCVFQ